MKKFMSVVLAFTLVMSFSLVGAQAAGEDGVWVESKSISTTATGSDRIVTIDIGAGNEMLDIGAVSLTVSFDTSKITLTKIENIHVGMGSSANNTNASGGTGKMNWATDELFGTNYAAKEVWYRLTMEVADGVPAGTYPISAVGSYGNSTTYEEISFSGAGTITVTEAPPVETTAFALSMTTDADRYVAGGTVTAEVSLAYAGGANIGSMGAEITYDSTYLTCTGIDGANDMVIGNVTTGKIALVANTPAGLAITEAGTRLATVTFTVNSPLSATVDTPIAFNTDECTVTKADADGVTLTPTVSGKSIKLVKQYTVTFDLGIYGQTDDQTSLTVDAGTILAAANIPAVNSKNAGYAFSGWDVPPVGVTVNENKTFIAQFTQNTVPVKFYSHNGEQIGATQNVQIGGKALATDPLFADHIFAGWFMVTDPATKYNVNYHTLLTTALVNAKIVNEAISYKANYDYIVTYTAKGADVLGITNGAKIVQGNDLTFTLKAQPGYTSTGATVTYSVYGVSKGAVPVVNGTYTISDADIIGSVEITINFPLDAAVTIVDFGAAPAGKTLVKVDGVPGDGKVYSIDGAPLFYSAKASAYVGFVAESYTEQTAAAAMSVVDGTAVTVAYTGDIDGNGKVLPNDARIVYTYYNNTQNYSIAGDGAYLALDFDGSLRVDATDVSAMINLYLGIG